MVVGRREKHLTQFNMADPRSPDPPQWFFLSCLEEWFASYGRFAGLKCKVFREELQLRFLLTPSGLPNPGARSRRLKSCPLPSFALQNEHEPLPPYASGFLEHLTAGVIAQGLGAQAPAHPPTCLSGVQLSSSTYEQCHFRQVI